MTVTFNAERFKRYGEQYFLKKQQKEFDWIVQSIGKQHELCEFHYGRFMEAFDDPQRKLARVNATDETRIKIEAHAFAFLMHLHALIDSFPYLLNELFPIQIKKKRLGWNEETFLKFEKLLDGNLYKKIDTLKKSRAFKKLKDHVNEAKHSGLPRIRDTIQNLCIVRMDGKSEELKPFMENTFNRLFTALFGLLQKVIEAAENERKKSPAPI